MMTDIIGVQNLPHSTLRNRFSGQIEGFLNIKDHEKSLKSLKKVRVPSKKMLEKRLLFQLHDPVCKDHK